MEIIFATGNMHKVREAQEILGPDYKLITPASLGITEDIPETGSTLHENSLQKARYVFERTGLACFADDTGLEVDSLGGEPGVYSARYAAMKGNAPEESHDFDANMDTLLKKLGDEPNRKARFRSVITLILPGGDIHCFEGEMTGRISYEKAGCGGFGYDPVFISDDFPQTTVAELPEGTKNTISHRGKALRKFADWVKNNVK